MATAPEAHAQAHDTAAYPNGSFDGPPGMQPGAAGAQRADPALHAPPPRIDHRRYWFHILAVDAAVVAAAFATEHPEPLLGNFVAGALVHALHGNTRSALLSPLLRAGLTTLGGLLGAASTDCGEPAHTLCTLGPIMTGVVIGAGTAMLIDYSLLARKRIVHAPATGISLVPSVSAGPDRFAFGLSGRF